MSDSCCTAAKADMKAKLRDRVAELTAIVGVSGYEWDVARAIREALIGHVDSIEVRPNGALIARKKGSKPGPRVLVSAHMDEVGYTVKSVTGNGFLFFDRVGGASEVCLPGMRVLVKGDKGIVSGVVGVRPAHLQQRDGCAYVDIAATSREEVEALGIRTGAQIVPDSPFREMANPDYICTRAADCRAMCAVIVETLRRLSADDICGEVCAVFNIVEETTIAAVSAAVTLLEPEYGIFLDTIPCGDVPDCDFERELPVGLNRGPVIVLGQQWAALGRYAASHPKLVAALRDAARATGTPHQELAFNGAGYITDAVGGLYAGKGMAVVTLGLPRRYSHSPVEIFNLNDAVGAQRVLEAVLKQPVDLTMIGNWYAPKA